MTFSILAVSTDRLHIGVATASFSLAVGAGVPALAPGLGAAVTQAWTLRAHRAHALQHLRNGTSPEAAVSLLAASDLEFPKRQVAVMDATGAASSSTGEMVSAAKGEIHGEGYVVLGNLLADAHVLEVMRDAMNSTVDEPLAIRLLTTLDAGRAAGGDIRGEQSAAIMVGSNLSPDEWPPDLEVDLRSDDHPRPISELWRMLELAPSGPARSVREEVPAWRASFTTSWDAADGGATLSD